jgi:hypothetical protein
MCKKHLASPQPPVLTSRRCFDAAADVRTQALNQNHMATCTAAAAANVQPADVRLEALQGRIMVARTCVCKLHVLLADVQVLGGAHGNTITGVRREAQHGDVCVCSAYQRAAYAALPANGKNVSAKGRRCLWRAERAAQGPATARAQLPERAAAHAAGSLPMWPVGASWPCAFKLHPATDRPTATAALANDACLVDQHCAAQQRAWDAAERELAIAASIATPCCPCSLRHQGGRYKSVAQWPRLAAPGRHCRGGSEGCSASQGA